MHPLTASFIESLEEDIRICEKRICIFEDDRFLSFPDVFGQKSGKELASQERKKIEETRRLIELLKKESS